ncbi:MAG: hypothetical protein GX610_06570 [Rhodococcus sp.]|nr:hypothetical protein [Rhodococcus sp. (in: high G+C Gram-positive bacteria)]
MMEPTPARFRALARSSPWRWNTVTFDWHDPHVTDPSRAWIRRPAALRVERPLGRCITTSTVDRPFDGMMRAKPGGPLLPVEGVWPTDARPPFDADGFVASRPDSFDVDYDQPFHQNYHWVAMLDPVEFADDGVDLSDVRPVSHHGRAAWEARVTPNGSYDPRCPCCSLLPGDDSSTQFAPAVIRLDVTTGICVHIERIQPERAVNLDVHIISVDTPLSDTLFGTHWS